MDTVKRMLVPGSVGGCVAALTVALAVRDPHEAGSWGLCPFLAMTGWQCPACGGLRAVNDLTHGDAFGALSSNLYFVLLLPVFAGLWVVWMRNSWQGRTLHLSRHKTRTVVYPVLAALLGLLVVFTVLRNTPSGAWLVP
ncbi:DUF2752 domain-containing protein [Nocardioides sp. NPDC058538]|uniref:DUF2752 domain-containing protein n=1 Tax=Nocardioides sp. NPDC058538 TaxID=3346542 RepID=UPI00364B5C34